MDRKTRKICLFQAVFNISDALGGNISLFAAIPIPLRTEKLHKMSKSATFFSKMSCHYYMWGYTASRLPTKWGWR
jgi:hypothetical protein